jgi:uncharacterized membrane-anchored protein YhcB (DUF1043 family)
MSITAYAIILLAGGLAAGFLLGRATGAQRRRVRTLEKDLRLASVRLEGAAQELKRSEQQLEDYRNRVVAHFTGTGEKLRDLTLQYRAVWEHLSEGARALCPEGALRLPGGLEALVPGASGREEPLPAERSAGKEAPSGDEAREGSDPHREDLP